MPMKKVKPEDCKFKDDYVIQANKKKDLKKLVNGLNEIVEMIDNFICDLGDFALGKINGIFEKIFEGKYKCHRSYMIGFSGDVASVVQVFRERVECHAGEFISEVQNDDTKTIGQKLKQIAKFKKECEEHVLSELYGSCKNGGFSKICGPVALESIRKKQNNKLRQLDDKLRIWLRDIQSEITSNDIVSERSNFYLDSPAHKEAMLRRTCKALRNLQQVCSARAGRLSKDDSIILKRFFSDDPYGKQQNRNWLKNSVKIVDPKPIRNSDDNTNRIFMSIFGILTDAGSGVDETDFAKRHVKVSLKRKMQLLYGSLDG